MNYDKAIAGWTSIKYVCRWCGNTFLRPQVFADVCCSKCKDQDLRVVKIGTIWTWKGAEQ